MDQPKHQQFSPLTPLEMIKTQHTLPSPSEIHKEEEKEPGQIEDKPYDRRPPRPNRDEYNQ